MPHPTHWCRGRDRHTWLLATLPLLLATVPPDKDALVRFNRDVRPILADRCFHCHGPDDAERKAKLRLDQPDGAEGAYRERGGTAAVVPGSPDWSELWYRITTDVEADVMPPAGSHKARLTQEEQDTIRRWIEGGAKYEAHWSFTAPRRVVSSQVRDEWVRTSVDVYVSRGHEALGLHPREEADRRTLIRRVTLDLTGLPPTREEVGAFLANRSDDAYEQLVGELLTRPTYGEHMARYWLDLVRFADTNGVHHDHYREMSPYRDWVIRAFNANLPFDEFTTYQLAGDLYPEPTDDQLIASGFHRLHMIIDRGTALPEESFARNVIDRVTAFGTVFMGLTAGCAVCHDHKYDPLTQRDFFRLSAFFNNIDADPETGSGDSDKKRGLQPPYVEYPSEEQRLQLEELAERLAESQARLDETQSEHDAADEAGKAAIKATLDERRNVRNAIRGERNGVLRHVPAAMVMRERAEPRPAHVLERGAYDAPGEEVGRGTPSFLPPLVASGDIPTRMDLARWVVSRDNPLTARVTVNRIWQQFFGVGLVKTTEDLGVQGEWPSDVDLLDHLALFFMDEGWDVKALIREIVLSATYRQSSRAEPEAFASDPENRHLARGPRFRMDAEMIRDQVLATSGLLNPEMYGPSVKPPQPEGVWKAVTLPSSYPREYHPDSGDRIYRRSLYTFWKRGMPPPQMSILNAPTRESCTARRERTNTPLQALLLLNEAEYLKAARHLAARVLREGHESPRARVIALYETVTAQHPDEEETEVLMSLVQGLSDLYRGDLDLSAALCGDVRVEGFDSPSLGAWTMLASALYNLDIAKTRE